MDPNKRIEVVVGWLKFRNSRKNVKNGESGAYAFAGWGNLFATTRVDIAYRKPAICSIFTINGRWRRRSVWGASREGTRMQIGKQNYYASVYRSAKQQPKPCEDRRSGRPRVALVCDWIPGPRAAAVTATAPANLVPVFVHIVPVRAS